MIPRREQIDLQPDGRGGRRDWEKPQRLFAAFFTAQGIPFIDLLPVLRAAQAEGPVYFRFDAHWTVRGHVVAAGAIADHLERADLLTGLDRRAPAAPDSPDSP